LLQEPPALTRAVRVLVERLERLYPGLPNARWVALRLLDGDERIIQAVRTGELAELARMPEANGGTPLATPALA
jgi:ferrous iron transport protein B